MTFPRVVCKVTDDQILHSTNYLLEIKDRSSFVAVRGRRGRRTFWGGSHLRGNGGGYQSSLTECKGELLEIDFQLTANEEGGGGVVRILLSLLSLCGDQENFILTPTNSSPAGDKS